MPQSHLLAVDYGVNRQESSQLISAMLQAGGWDAAQAQGVRVFMVDFCTSVPHLHAISQCFGELIVLDHHATTEKALSEHCPLERTSRKGWSKYRVARTAVVYFCMEQSGAMMAWNYFHSKRDADGAWRAEGAPRTVRWVEDRDLWRFNYPDTNLFHAGMTLHMPFEHQRYRKALQNVAGVLAQGQTLERHKEIVVQDLASKPIHCASLTDPQGTQIQCVILNSTTHVSDLCAKLLQVHPEASLAIAYVIGHKSRVTYSVRSRKNYDSSWWSVAHGGGGHAQASGFSSDLARLTSLLTTTEWQMP
jgi:oligoribonuclease NrnB/cAMP/cGMP phosphodiesterase (DHH superfamily)